MLKTFKKIIFKRKFYFERLFSKKEFMYIILLKPGYDVILKFINGFLTFKLFKYKTFIKYIFFKTNTLKNNSYKDL